MKKLMIAALAASAVGGAFATPVVYDYKASVKHMYEKLAKSGTVNVYVKYVKSSKLVGYFVQDYDGSSLLANKLADGSTPQSEKRGFLVLMNRSAENNYRQPKIMPAQLDAKVCVTGVKSKGASTQLKFVSEAYFYAGPFAGFDDANNEWDGDYDDAADYLFNNAVGGAPGVAARTYGTAGSTLNLFGQHNTYNRFTNLGAEPAAGNGAGTVVYAFGDAWLNGAGFGTGTASSALCCGWATVGTGNNIFRSISGNLKGGVFLCGIGNYPANSPLGYFALGLEDLFRSDIPGTNIAKTKQGDDNAVAEDPADRVTWADGDIALSTTDVVSGSWAIRPSSKFTLVPLTDAEVLWFAGGAGTANADVLAYIKSACRALNKNYSLYSNMEPRELKGKAASGLITPEFRDLFL